MTMADRIQERVSKLPEPSQREVLDFVEYLVHRLRQDDLEWSQFSIAAAERGMEQEAWPEYREEDLVDKWR